MKTRRPLWLSIDVPDRTLFQMYHKSFPLQACPLSELETVAVILHFFEGLPLGSIVSWKIGSVQDCQFYCIV